MRRYGTAPTVRTGAGVSATRLGAGESLPNAPASVLAQRRTRRQSIPESRSSAHGSARAGPTPGGTEFDSVTTTQRQVVIPFWCVASPQWHLAGMMLVAQEPLASRHADQHWHQLCRVPDRSCAGHHMVSGRGRGARKGYISLVLFCFVHRPTSARRRPLSTAARSVV
jgi:hypothetical protein